MIILIPLSALIIALNAQNSNLCGDTCWAGWEVCVEVNATTGICEWANCANTGEFDAYCQREDGPEYVCETYTYSDGSTSAYCSRRSCSSNAECSDIGSGEYFCDDEDYGECRAPCSPTSDTCSYSEFCNDDGRCEYKTCGNYYNGTAYCQSDYGPEYECKQYSWSGEYYCGEVDCEVTADCAAAIGIGYVCDEYYGECTLGCTNDLFCEEEYFYYTNPYVCDLETSLCVETCSTTEDCGWSEICNEIGRCEQVPYCVADASQCDLYGTLFGYQAVCNEVTGDCDFVDCEEDDDCDLGEYGTCSPALGFCIDPCQSDMECRERFDSLSDFYGSWFNSSRAYCVDNALVCTEAYMTCDTHSDCYSGEICEDGLCQVFLCQNDAECARDDGDVYVCYDDYFNTTDYGICVEVDCTEDADCIGDGENNACLTYDGFGYPFGFCYQSCNIGASGNCRAGDDSFSCEVVEKNAVECGFPMEDVYICTNETDLPMLNDSTSCPTPSPTKSPTTEDERSGAGKGVLFGVMAVGLVFIMSI